MLKRIDKLGRVVIPISFRQEIGVNTNEYVEILRQEDKIMITKINKVPTKEEIEHVYNDLKQTKNIDINNEYNKGFKDALKFVLGKENENE